MDYISQSPIHFSKVNLKFFLSAPNFPEKKPMVICSRQTANQLNTDIITFVMVLTKKKGGKNKYTCPMFYNEFLASSKKLKLHPRYFIFPIK